jgi:hypothetical protein
MTDVLQLLQYAVSVGFVGLSIAILIDWLRYRERSRGYLALAIGLLGVTSLLGRVSALLGAEFYLILTALTLAALMGSGYMLLLFRDTFVPLTQRMRNVALVAVVFATVLEIGVIAVNGSRPGGLLTAATIFLVAVWSGCVLEPIARLWVASRGKPAVQRARLRALSVGYAGLVVVLLIAGIGGSAASTPAVQIVTQGMALLVVPLLYASFAPPRWLRRAWREKVNCAVPSRTSCCSVRTAPRWPTAPPNGPDGWSARKALR